MAPADLAATAPGDRRMLAQPWCRDLAAALHSLLVARDAIDATAVAVQCTLFHKDQDHDWLVPMHQDLTVPLRERRTAPGWSAWSVKDGVAFAQPPLPVLQSLLAARLHLDDADADNGALAVVPRSQRAGRLTPAAAAAARARTGEVLCAAQRGDVLLLRPLLLHRSGKLESNRPRRVLHFVFGPAVLPDGLQWAVSAGR